LNAAGAESGVAGSAVEAHEVAAVGGSTGVDSGPELDPDCLPSKGCYVAPAYGVAPAPPSPRWHPTLLPSASPGECPDPAAQRRKPR
jgi:hypothetical protein